jgi:hypothetical protein
MAVSEHEAVRRDHDTRSGAVVPTLRCHIETHYRRADALDHVNDGAGICVEKRLVIGNRGRASEISGRSVEHGCGRCALREAARPRLMRR